LGYISLGEYFSSNLDADSYKRLSDSVNKESRVFDENPLTLTFTQSDEDVEYEISLFDVIEFKRIETNDKPTLETQYPAGWRNEDINAGDLKYVLDSQLQFFSF
jgi:hypothetical protein